MRPRSQGHRWTMFWAPWLGQALWEDYEPRSPTAPDAENDSNSLLLALSFQHPLLTNFTSSLF